MLLTVFRRSLAIHRSRLWTKCRHFRPLITSFRIFHVMAWLSCGQFRSRMWYSVHRTAFTPNVVQIDEGVLLPLENVSGLEIGTIIWQGCLPTALILVLISHDCSLAVRRSHVFPFRSLPLYRRERLIVNLNITSISSCYIRTNPINWSLH